MPNVNTSLFTHRICGGFCWALLEEGREGRLWLDGDDALLVEPYALEDEGEELALGGGIRLLAPEDREVVEHPLGLVPEQVDIKRLIDVVTRRDKRVEVPGTHIVLGRDEVREAINRATITGIKDKKRDEKDADKLEAPVSAVKAATREVTKAVGAVKAVADDPDFDQKRRKSLEFAYNKLKRSCRDLEAELTKAKVLGE
jgi:hypothetical protein